jgi:redox-sensitive bicupin YhaK (pirin superfamily)
MHPLVADHHAFVYVYEGIALIGAQDDMRPLASQTAGVLSAGDQLELLAGDEPVAYLLLAAKPLREPVVQYGPFVMNTREEIEQAMRDYKNGQLVSTINEQPLMPKNNF